MITFESVQDFKQTLEYIKSSDSLKKLYDIKKQLIPYCEMVRDNHIFFVISGKNYALNRTLIECRTSKGETIGSLEINGIVDEVSLELESECHSALYTILFSIMQILNERIDTLEMINKEEEKKFNVYIKILKFSGLVLGVFVFYTAFKNLLNFV